MISNYDQGFAQGLTVRGIPVVQAHPGKVFWVGNSSTTASLRGEKGESDGNDGTFLAPFSTIDYALSQCVADRGDIVFVRPGYTETVGSTDLTLDVAGVAVIGLGSGSNRPTLNLTATGSTIAITAANVLMHNFLITGGVDAIVAVMTVSAADVTLSKLEFRDVTGQATDGILTTASANRLMIDGLVWVGATADGPAAAIAIVGGDRIEIQNFYIAGDFSVSAIDVRTTLTTGLRVHDGFFWNNDAAVDTSVKDTIGSSTGQIGPNLFIQTEEHGANITEVITGATFVVFDPVYVVNLANEKAMLINWTASADL